MFVVQNKMVPTPEGSFCMLVLLTASILDRIGILQIGLITQLLLILAHPKVVRLLWFSMLVVLMSVFSFAIFTYVSR